MNRFFKRISIGLLVIGSLLLAGYGAYRLYEAAIEDATRRIKQGVTEGVSKGISSGIVDTINPLTWPAKIFGSKHKKDKKVEEKSEQGDQSNG